MQRKSRSFFQLSFIASTNQSYECRLRGLMFLAFLCTCGEPSCIFLFTCVSACICGDMHMPVCTSGWICEFDVWSFPTTFFYVADRGMVFYVDSGDVKVTTHTCAASFYIRSHLPSWKAIFHYHNGHIQDEIGVCILLKWLKTLRFFTVLALDESFIIKLLLTQNCQDDVNAFIIIPLTFHELALFPSYLSSLLLSHHKAMSGHTICCPHYPYCSFLLRLSDGVFYWKSVNFTLFVTLISMLLLIIFFILSRLSNFL